MFNTAIGLAALIFLLVLVRYVVQLIKNNARLFAITERGYELELEITRARLTHALAQATQTVSTNQSMWNGFRRFQIIYKAIEAKDYCSFYLAPVDGKPLPAYLPGQYLTFKLDIPGQSKPVIRCYSLSDSPNHPDYYRVTVKRQLPPKDVPEAPPGISSSFFHDCLNERDVVDVKAPNGHFYLDMEDDSPVVLIGAGAGITPVLSMLNTITEKDSHGKLSTRETWVFLGCRNSSDHVMKHHLENIAKEHNNIFLHVCYSQPTEDDFRGRDYHHQGRITAELLSRVLPSNNFEFFYCGPPQMMEDLHEGLGKWGVPEDKINYEAFNSTSMQKLTGAETTQTDSSLQVTFAKSKVTVPWNPAAGSLLAFAEENGILLESGCRTGNCGSCLTTIERGLVTYLLEPGKRPDARSCLACISVPKTDLTLDG